MLPFLARGEAMLQLFNVNWNELSQKMPEIAEAGYTSLWLPPPAKAGSVYSVGYDLFDPFDLGDKDQRGTLATRYGTKAELLNAVEMAHRFGLRVYFDNIMNHRGFDVPGFDANTPTNLYPGLSPKDFHLRTQADGTYRNWNNVSDWGNVSQVQNRPLFGLLDLANEPGNQNWNFGATEGSTTTKPFYVRQPGSNNYYMDTNLPPIVGPWRPFNGTSGDPVAEDVNAYLIRAALWTLNETRCDGFRFDAVKHVPSAFFGATSANHEGYVGAIQTMFDYVHGYGTNVTANGYVESDDNRNSGFDTETSRNDALLFGEHLGEPPSFQEYLDRGMRLLNSPYHYQFNNIFGNPGASIAGLEQRDYTPGYGFSGRSSVMFAQSHDDGFANRRELHNGYNFFREGLPSIYSDGYNESTAIPGQDPFPRHAKAPYLGQFGDNKMPDVAWLHHQLARGGTRPRWGSAGVAGSINDPDVIAFERYDYRDSGVAADQTVVLFAMNDNYAGVSGDISFDDSAAQTTAGTFYECFPVNNSRGQGLVVGFPPGTVLVQLADSPNKERACSKLLVRKATGLLSEAQSTANHSDPVERKVYVGGQALAPGGGAIEFKVPSGSYVAYGLQWPEPSRVNLRTNVIMLRQAGVEAPRITVLRHDGVNGDPNFNPLYPFKMRGSVDPAGNLIGGSNVSNRTYAIDVPILTNAPFDIVVDTDASAVNVLMKLDGGMDLNSQMNFAPTTGFDRRDNRPGSATDTVLGYEQALWRFRYGPEKFAAQVNARNNITSLGAETYYYTVGVTNGPVINGSGNGASINTSTATNVIHIPSATTTVVGQSSVTQRNPLDVTDGQAADIWVKVWIKFRINRCFLYYTTDGSNPEGAHGKGVGTTQVIEGGWIAADTGDSNIDWWKATIPPQPAGTQVRYKVALFHDNVIPPISDADRAKLFGMTEFSITNCNPTTATVWLHNNLKTNDTRSGLATGFHILRARCFLPRDGKSGVYNTFLQTFYYDGALPTGTIAFPPQNGDTITSGNYTVVVRADSSVTGVEFNIQDSDPSNDDTVTAQNNGNGLTNGVPRFVAASPVTPDASLNAQYPDYPLEFRFNYASVPNSGMATNIVRLKGISASVYPDRVTTLTRTINTASPASVVFVNNPSADGQIHELTNGSTFLLHTCFTSTLTTNDASRFSIYLNGQFQPRNGFIFLPSGCGAGLRSLYYFWTNPPPGSNLIEVVYTNLVIIPATRTMVVARPGDSDGDGLSDVAEIIAGTDPYDSDSVLRITELADGNQLVVWSSVPGRDYQVLATADLTQPMQVISPIIPASGARCFFYDGSPDATNKFYRIQVVP